VGMEQATRLLGELQENEIASFLSWGGASSKPDQEALSEMPPVVVEIQPPTCPQLHLWNNEDSGPNNAVITTSLPLAPDMANHQMGKMAPAVITTIPPSLASPGKAVNGRGTIRPHEDPIQEVQAKCQKSSTSVDESLSQFWLPNLLDIIKSIVKLESPCPVKLLFVFNLDSKAVEIKYLILKMFYLNIGHALEAQSSSPLGYGSEFRKGNTLFPLLRYHPLWLRIEQLLLEGSKWPTTPSLRSAE
jgi:hypothetical protein